LPAFFGREFLRIGFFTSIIERQFLIEGGGRFESAEEQHADTRRKRDVLQRIVLRMFERGVTTDVVLQTDARRFFLALGLTACFRISHG